MEYISRAASGMDRQRWMPALIATVILFLAQSGPARANEFAPFFWNPDVPDAVGMFGEIDERATFNFGRIMRAHPNVKVLALDSPGGMAMNALVIADQVHASGMNTVIPSGWKCYSACAYIFFAGRIRQNAGELGVHQVSAREMGADDAQVMAADLLDALARYGVSPGVISRMLRTPPNDMHVFSAQEMKMLAINRSAGEASNADLDGPPISEDASTAARAEAINLVQVLVQAHQENDAGVLDRIGAFYAPQIDYFGKTVSQSELLDDKRRYFARWPTRRTTIDPSSLDVRCTVERECVVSGRYRWEVANQPEDREANGTATFRYRLQLDSDAPVVAEDGKVVR